MTGIGKERRPLLAGIMLAGVLLASSAFAPAAHALTVDDACASKCSTLLLKYVGTLNKLVMKASIKSTSVDTSAISMQRGKFSAKWTAGGACTCSSYFPDADIACGVLLASPNALTGGMYTYPVLFGGPSPEPQPSGYVLSQSASDNYGAAAVNGCSF